METLYKVEFNENDDPILVEAEIPVAPATAQFAVLGHGDKIVTVGDEGTRIKDLAAYDGRKIYLIGTTQLPHDFLVLPGMKITVADSVANG